jgi:hypothetical protein
MLTVVTVQTPNAATDERLVPAAGSRRCAAIAAKQEQCTNWARWGFVLDDGRHVSVCGLHVRKGERNGELQVIEDAIGRPPLPPPPRANFALPPRLRMVWWQETPVRKAIVMLGRDHPSVPSMSWARRWIPTGGGRWSEHEVAVPKAGILHDATGPEAEKAIGKALEQLCHHCGGRVYPRRTGRAPWRCSAGRCPRCCASHCTGHAADAPEPLASPA